MHDYESARGIIDYRVQKDRYENDISLIALWDSDRMVKRTKFRMVHHTVPYKHRQKATIYIEPGRSVKFKSFSDSNTRIHTLNVAGFSAKWVDGICGTVIDPNNQVCQVQTISASKQAGLPVGSLGTVNCLVDDNEEAEVLLFMLDALRHLPEQWFTKSVKEKLDM